MKASNFGILVFLASFAAPAWAFPPKTVDVLRELFESDVYSTIIEQNTPPGLSPFSAVELIKIERLSRISDEYREECGLDSKSAVVIKASFVRMEREFEAFFGSNGNPADLVLCPSL